MYEPCCVVVFDLSDSTKFFPNYLINLAIIGRMFMNLKSIFQLCIKLKYFSFQEEFRKIMSKMYIRICVKYRILLCGLKKFWSNLKNMRRFSNTKSINMWFQATNFSGDRQTVTDRQWQRDRQTHSVTESNRNRQTDRQRIIVQRVNSFRNLLSLLPTSGAIFPPVLIPSLHTHDHVHRHTQHIHVRSMYNYMRYFSWTKFTKPSLRKCLDENKEEKILLKMFPTIATWQLVKGTDSKMFGWTEIADINISL
jgi:hypothetical protein